MTAAISRVGLVAKHRVDAAAAVLQELAAWLEARGIGPVFDNESAHLAGVRDQWETTSKEDLPKACELIVLLGGDGTLIGMARRIARANVDVPIAGVNFGSLGFLTEVRIDELYPTLDSVVNGTAEYHERAMLVADACRGGECFDSRIVLNDVVFTKAALSRIIELSISVSTGLMTKVKAEDRKSVV